MLTILTALILGAHPCIAPPATAYPLAPIAGQPAAIALAATSTASNARVYAADTVAGVCLGELASTTVAGKRAWTVLLASRTTSYAFAPTADAPTPTRATAAAVLLAHVVPPPVITTPPVVPPPVVVPPAPVVTAPVVPPSVDVLRARYVPWVAQLLDKRQPIDGVDWAAANYYDRAHIACTLSTLPELAARAQEFRDRCAALAVNYRDVYLKPNAYSVQPHQSQLAGLVDHWLMTGDSASRTAVLKSADAFQGWLTSKCCAGYLKPSDGEPRILARVLQSQTYAYALADSASRRRYRLAADSVVYGRALPFQAADGSYPAVQICGGQLNYMVGILNDALIRYYETINADPRILDVVQRGTDYLWRTQWRADGSFNYASVACPLAPNGISVGGPTAAPDLNAMIAPSFWWLAKMTGDATYRVRGDAILTAGIATAFTGASKQTNEQGALALSALAWR